MIMRDNSSHVRADGIVKELGKTLSADEGLLCVPGFAVAYAFCDIRQTSQPLLGFIVK